MRTFIVLLSVCFLSVNCGKKEPFAVVEVDEPVLFGNTVFSSFEDLTSPKFKTFREKYMLDTVFHGEEDEFKRMLILRNWIRTVMDISDFEDSYPGDDYADRILDAGLKGQGFHCGHYKIVQNAVMNSFGYVTRCLGAGPGVKGGPNGHHGINEIWSNKFHKWFLSDAKYNHHFEKDGIPLSALEIRDEYLKNKAAEIVLVKGPDRVPIDGDGLVNSKGVVEQWGKERFAQTYTWIEWEAFNNRFTQWPDNDDAVSHLNMYADDYYKNNTWIWDGKPHWAYKTEFMIPVADRNAIEWTPNTVKTDVKINGDKAIVKLYSDTPNLRSYQMKRSSENEWRDVGESFEVELTEETNELSFRTINLAGVTGVASRVVVARGK
jgi:hypothetical protein